MDKYGCWRSRWRWKDRPGFRKFFNRANSNEFKCQLEKRSSFYFIKKYRQKILAVCKLFVLVPVELFLSIKLRSTAGCSSNSTSKNSVRLFKIYLRSEGSKLLI